MMLSKDLGVPIYAYFLEFTPRWPLRILYEILGHGLLYALVPRFLASVIRAAPTTVSPTRRKSRERLRMSDKNL